MTSSINKLCLLHKNLVHYFNLQLGAVRKLIRRQILDNCFAWLSEALKNEPWRKTGIKLEVFKISGLLLFLHWVELVDGCKTLSPSSRDISSVLHVFVHLASFHTVFWRRGYQLQNLYRIRLQITSTAWSIRNVNIKYKLSQYLIWFLRYTLLPTIDLYINWIG